MKLKLLILISVSLWLGVITLATAQESMPEIEISTEVLEKPTKPPNITELYFNTSLKVTKGLHDPQEILDEEQQDIIKDLISEHQKKSQIPITLFLFKLGQKIPLTKLKIANRIGKIFSTGNHILVFYHYGEVLNSTGYLLLEDEEKLIVENWEIDEMFLKSSRGASVDIKSFNQLQNYIQELSKRSFWIESKFIAPPPVIEEDNPEITHPPVAVEKPNQIIEFISEHILSIIAAIAVLIAGVWFYLWSTKWRKYVLPLKDMPRRLGADYGATVSTPLEFSDVKVSLSDQRSKARNNSFDNI